MNLNKYKISKATLHFHLNLDFVPTQKIRKMFYQRTTLPGHFQTSNVNENKTEEYKWLPKDAKNVVKTLNSLKQQLTKFTMKK